MGSEPPALPVVAVPARNEEQRLPGLVKALGSQDWLSAQGWPLRVTIVLNNGTDRSAAVLRDLAPRHPRLHLDVVEVEFPAEAAHVGSARRLAMDRALAGGGDPFRTVVLTTDADAVPDPGWIGANLAAVADGADLVGGRIIGNRDEEAQLGPGFARRAGSLLRYAGLTDRLAAVIDPLPYDPWPRHRDHTGASLAVRGDVYRQVGGMPALPFREDLGFVSLVRAAGGRLRHAPDVRVQVSARLVGRAPGGMADCLKDWMRAEAEGRPLLVEAPERVEARLLRRRMLRDLAGAGEAGIAAAAAHCGAPLSSFLDADAKPLSPPRLIERFAPDEPDAPADTPIEAATARLARMIARRGDSAFAA